MKEQKSKSIIKKQLKHKNPHRELKRTPAGIKKMNKLRYSSYKIS
jgi:hypothetical protein